MSTPPPPGTHLEETLRTRKNANERLQSSSPLRVLYSAVHCIALKCYLDGKGQCGGTIGAPIALKCSTIQCSTVQYSAVHCSTVQYRAVQFITVNCSAVQYSKVRINASRCTVCPHIYIQCITGRAVPFKYILAVQFTKYIIAGWTILVEYVGQCVWFSARFVM